MSDGSQASEGVAQEGAPTSSDAEDEVQGEADPQRDVKQLRKSWQFASVVQFCRIFAEGLKLRAFSADYLEASLVNPEGHRMFLSELMFKLLRSNAALPYTEKDSEIWEDLLRQKMNSRWWDRWSENPLAGRDFFSISTNTRLGVLHALCDWRSEECGVVKEAIRRMVEDAEYSADALRHRPIGEDASGRRYFYFSFNNEDCRLYRESPPAAKAAEDVEAKASWDTVCTTIEEMTEFAEQFSASRHRGEKSIHNMLLNSIIPGLIETVAARKRAEDKAAALEAMPRKRSSRIQVLNLQKEEADRRAREEEEERRRNEKENEKKRQDREREMRLLAKQQDEEERRLASIEHRRKLAGINLEGPSREERMHKRVNGEGTRSNTPELEANGTEEVQEALAPSTDPSIAEFPEPEAQPEVLQVPSPPPSEAPSPSVSPPPEARRREHDAGWSPLGPWVPCRQRTQELRPVRRFAQLIAVAKGTREQLAPKRSGEAFVEATWGKPVHGLLMVRPGSRHRPSRKAKEMDIDYEEEDDEESEEELPRPRSNRARGQALAAARAAASGGSGGSGGSGAPPRQPQAAMSALDYEYQQQMRRIQEQEMQQRQRIMQQPHPSQESLERALAALSQQSQQMQLMLKERHATALAQEQQQRRLAQSQGRMQGGYPNQAALEATAAEKVAMQRQQQLMQLIQTLTPQQRAQVSQMHPNAQAQFLERMRVHHLQMQQSQQQQAQQQEAQRIQQQTVLHQQVIQQLTPQQLHLLREMPRAEQQATLNKLSQQLLQQQRERSQMMQLQQQASGPMAHPMGVQRISSPAAHAALNASGPQQAMHLAGMSGSMQSGSALRTSSGNLSGGRMPMYRPQQAGEMEPSLPSVSGQYGSMPGGVQRWQGAPGSQMPAPRFPGSQMIPLGERGEGPHSGPSSPGFPSSPSLGRPPRPMSSPSMPAGAHPEMQPGAFPGMGVRIGQGGPGLPGSPSVPVQGPISMPHLHRGSSGGLPPQYSTPASSSSPTMPQGPPIQRQGGGLPGQIPTQQPRMGSTGTAWPAAAQNAQSPLAAVSGLPEPPIEDDFGDLDVLAGDAFSDKPESTSGLDPGGPARAREGGASQPQKPGQPDQAAPAGSIEPAEPARGSSPPWLPETGLPDPASNGDFLLHPHASSLGLETGMHAGSPSLEPDRAPSEPVVGLGKAADAVELQPGKDAREGLANGGAEPMPA